MPDVKNDAKDYAGAAAFRFNDLYERLCSTEQERDALKLKLECAIALGAQALDELAETKAKLAVAAQTLEAWALAPEALVASSHTPEPQVDAAGSGPGDDTYL